MKICKSCGENLEDNKFPVNYTKNGKTYYRNVCYECRRKKNKTKGFNRIQKEENKKVEVKKIEVKKQDYNFTQDEIIILKDIIKNYSEINFDIADKTNRTAKTFNVDLDLLERINKFTKENRMQSFSDSMNFLLSKSLDLLKY